MINTDMTEEITGGDLEDIEKASLPFAGAKPARTCPDKEQRDFVKKLAKAFPLLMGGKDIVYFDDPAIEGKTLLARVIAAINYTPSSLSLLSKPAKLAKLGYFDDSDCKGMTYRVMTEHCTIALLSEIHGACHAHENKLREAGKKHVDDESESVFEELNDDESFDAALGMEIDQALAEGATSTETEIAERSKIWGSW